jgi:chorismate mutase
MAVPGSLERCIRVLVHWNTTRRADQIMHVYLRGARNLRPERALLLSRRAESDTPITSREAER